MAKTIAPSETRLSLTPNGFLALAREERGFTVRRVGCPRLARGRFTTHTIALLSPTFPFPRDGKAVAGERGGGNGLVVVAKNATIPRTSRGHSSNGRVNADDE